MRQLYWYILTAFLVVFLSCKSSTSEQDFTVDGWYPFSELSETQLSDSGKKRALAVWDSIRPLLNADSAVRGTEYSDIHVEDRDGLLIWLSFDVDKTSSKASNFTFHILPTDNKFPVGFMYFGDVILTTSKFINLGKGSMSQEVDIILEHGIRRLISGEGIRYDTDRGPTEKPSTKQIAALKRVFVAYTALSLLQNDLNRNQLN